MESIKTFYPFIYFLRKAAEFYIHDTMLQNVHEGKKDIIRGKLTICALKKGIGPG